MKKNYIESVLGILTLIVAISFFLKLVDANTVNSSNQSYSLKAKFLKVGGIMIGNDVKLRGVKVGVVNNVKLDDDFFAVVEFKIYSNVKIPRSSKISVSSDGILGNKYLSILPGEIIDGDFLAEFDEITNVADYESIEDQVSKIIFLATQ